MNSYKVFKYKVDANNTLHFAEVKDWVVEHKLKSRHHDYDDDNLYVVKNTTPHFVTYYVPSKIANQLDWANATQEDIIKHFETHM